MTAFGGEQIKTGVSDKVKDGQADDGTGCLKVQDFDDLRADFRKMNTSDIRGEGKSSEFERKQRAN